MATEQLVTLGLFIIMIAVSYTLRERLENKMITSRTVTQYRKHLRMYSLWTIAMTVSFVRALDLVIAYG